MSDQYLRILRSLVKALNTLKISLDHHESTICEHQQTTENRDQHPLPIEIRSELPFPIPVREYCEAEQRERKSAWRKIKGGLEILGVAAAVTLAIFTYLTLLKVSSQADSAQKQVGIMQAQNRPWIKVIDVQLRKGIPPILTFSFQHFRITTGEELTQATLNIEFVVKNIGHSVAQMVMIEPKLFFTPASPTEFMNLVEKEERRFCDEMLSRKPDMAARSAIFPDDLSVWDIGVPAIVKATDLMPSSSDPVKAYVSGVLIACINYSFSPIAEHFQPQTCVVYHIYGDKTRFLKVGEDIPAERMKIVRDESAEYAQ